MNHQVAKRIDIVSVKLVKESSVLYQPRKVSTSGDLFELIREFIGERDREYLVVIGVSAKNEPTLINTAPIGSVTQSIIHVREIMKPLILSNADSFFIGHNHLSGYLEPSENDILFTKQLKEAGKLIGIKLVDHLIVNEREYYSLKDFGLC